jgi:hypothetical protein
MIMRNCKTNRQDFYRVVAFVAVAAALYLFDHVNIAVIQAFGIGAFMALGSHITRRILFPSLDLQAIGMVAVNTRNLGAAIVFASISLVLVALMFLGLSILKP